MIQETSTKSYNECFIDRTVNNNQEMVYKALLRLGEATDRELTEFLGLEDPDVIRPRRKELVDLGEVIESKKRKCRVSGKWVIAWKPKGNNEKVIIKKKECLSNIEMNNLIRTLQKKIPNCNNYQYKLILNSIKGLYRKNERLSML